jgi:hypothetical protein
MASTISSSSSRLLCNILDKIFNVNHYLLQTQKLVKPSMRWSSNTSSSFCSSLCSVNEKNANFHRTSSLRHTSHKLDHQTIERRLISTSSLCYLKSPIVQQTTQQQQQPINPFKLAENDLNCLYADIRKELWTERPELEEIAGYYFDGQGKAFRPMVVVLIARALNHHINRNADLLESQKTVAMVTEMIHTASLVHDDVIDTADTRRGKASVNVLWGQKKAILAGDYILSRASQMLARLQNEEVILVLSQVLIVIELN